MYYEVKEKHKQYKRSNVNIYTNVLNPGRGDDVVLLSIVKNRLCIIH